MRARAARAAAARARGAQKNPPALQGYYFVRVLLLLLRVRFCA
jgi:hypothetical protein